MKRTDNPPRASALPRTLSIALLVVAATLASSFEGAPSSQGRTATSSPRPSQRRELSRTDRYAYQRAIEEVYWRHRIWPKERPDPKPSLDEVMGPSQIEQKVENALQSCRVLEEHLQQPIRAGQLQAEMDRMARQTRQPDLLQELFDALGNDPLVIAECLAKPVLSERLLSRLTQEQRIPLDESWAAGSAEKMANRVAVSATGYTLPAISGGSGVDSCEDDTWAPTFALLGREGQTAIWTGTEMIVWGGVITQQTISNTGSRYNPSTDSWLPMNITNAPVARYFHTAVWSGTEMCGEVPRAA